MEKENKEVAEFCVDSNVIMDLFYLYKNNKAGIVNTLKRKRGSTDYVAKMYSLLKDEQIRLYVPYGVLGDLYYLDRLDFSELKEFLETHNFVNMKSVAYRHKDLGPIRATLAWRYSKALSPELIEMLQKRIGDKGVNLNLHRPIFELSAKGKPSKHAQNVAESAVAGLPFVTVNDQIYRKCYREEMIEFTNRGIAGVDGDAKPITPEYMFQLAESANKPQLSPVFAKALAEIHSETKSFDFEPIVTEPEMNM